MKWVEDNAKILLAIAVPSYLAGMATMLDLGFHLRENAATFVGALVGAIAAVLAALWSVKSMHDRTADAAEKVRASKASAIASLIFDEMNRARMTIQTIRTAVYNAQQAGNGDAMRQAARDHRFVVAEPINAATAQIDCFGVNDVVYIAAAISDLHAAVRRNDIVGEWKADDFDGSLWDQIYNLSEKAITEFDQAIFSIRTAETVLERHGAKPNIFR